MSSALVLTELSGCSLQYVNSITSHTTTLKDFLVLHKRCYIIQLNVLLS